MQDLYVYAEINNNYSISDTGKDGIMENIKSAANYNGELMKTPAPPPSPQAGAAPSDNEVSTKQKKTEEPAPAYIYTKGIYLDEQEESRDNIQMERYQKMLEKIRNQNKKLKPKKPKVDFNAVTELIQLANSETVSQASAVLSRVMVRYSTTASSDDKEVIALRGSMLKVIRKARLKIKKLKNETRLCTRKKHAEAQQREAEVKKLEHELSIRKRNRKFKEQNDILEAVKEETLKNSKTSGSEPSADYETAQLKSRLSALYAALETAEASSFGETSPQGISGDSTEGAAEAAAVGSEQTASPI